MCHDVRKKETRAEVPFVVRHPETITAGTETRDAPILVHNIGLDISFRCVTREMHVSSDADFVDGFARTLSRLELFSE